MRKQPLSLSIAVILGTSSLGLMSPLALSAESATTMEEVIVSARKRDENMQDVPMSISAVGAVEIEKRNALDKEDLYRSLAGAAAPRGELILRGLSGSNDSAPNTTSTFTDGVPFDFSDLYDVERVEVLRGPQGTLWGSNAIGGTVHVVTKKPNTDKFELFASTNIASEEHNPNLSTRGYIGANIPLSDSLALRIAGSARSEPQKIYNAYTSTFAKSEGSWLRAKALWEINEDMELGASYYHTQDKTSGYEYADRSQPDGYYTMDLTPDAAEPTGYLVSYGFVDCEPGQERAACRQGASTGQSQNAKYTVWELLDEWVEEETELFSLNFSHHNIGGLLSLDYVGSYREVTDAGLDNWSREDGSDLFRTWIINRNFGADAGTRWTHELRVNSFDATSPLQWTAGYYYDKQDYGRVPDVQFQYQQGDDGGQTYAKADYWWGIYDWLGVTLDEFGRQMYGDPNKNYNINQIGGFAKEQALFGELSYTFDLGDAGNLELTGGIRFFEIEDAYESIESGIWIDGFNVSHTESSGSNDGDRKKFSVAYRPSDDLSIYGLYSEGYRPGGSNMPSLPHDCVGDPSATWFAPRYESDEIQNYELGVKGSVIDNRFNFASAIYQIDWTGVQADIYMDTCGFSYIGNAGEAQSRGVEFESTAQLSDNLGLTLNFSYTDSEMTSDAPWVGAEKGDDMTMVPKYNFYGALDYDYTIADKRASARLAVSAYDEYKSHFNTKPEDVSPAYATWDLSTTIDVSDNATVGLFVDNLLNEEVITYRRSRSRGSSSQSAKYVYYGNERTLSLRVDLKF